MQTQNVQNLLREAKREMVLDIGTSGPIHIGGDDLTVKNKKKINFNGT